MFLHTFHPPPILFSFGPFSIHWYGLFMMLGIAAGYAIARRNFSSAHLPVTVLNDLFIYLVLCGFVGARLYHVLNELPLYWEHPLWIFAIWRGGLAIHGALLAGVIVIWFFIRKHSDVYDKVINNSHREGCKLQDTITRKIPITNIQRPRLFLISYFLFLADLLAPSVALGQAIGRWGNYFRQELFGPPTNLPWGIPIDAAHRLSDFMQYEYFHPVFLYESVWLFIVCIVLLGMLHAVIPGLTRDPERKNKNRFSLRFWIPACAGMTVKKYRPGLVFFLYLILAGLGRFFIEFLRIDPMPLIFGIRLQQLVSLLLMGVGFSGIVLLYRKLNRKNGIPLQIF